MSNTAPLETDHLEFVAAAGRTNCGIVGRDLDGIVSFTNDRILSWLGYTWNELVSNPLSHVIPKELETLFFFQRDRRHIGNGT